MTAKIAEIVKTVRECGFPSRVSLYDEEGVEGWEWEHPDGRTWTSTENTHPLLDGLYVVKETGSDKWVSFHRPSGFTSTFTDASFFESYEAASSIVNSNNYFGGNYEVIEL